MLTDTKRRLQQQLFRRGVRRVELAALSVADARSRSDKEPTKVIRKPGRPRIAGCFQCRLLVRLTQQGKPVVGGKSHTCGGPKSDEYRRSVAERRRIIALRKRGLKTKPAVK